MSLKSRLLFFLLALLPFSIVRAQIYQIPAGQIIPGNGPTCFNFQVSGVGTVYPPGWGPWSPFIDNLELFSIYTTHPQTLLITLTSPAGTTLTLSAYNGAGGSNYINTVFTIASSFPITSGTAPFTGQFTPQGTGGFSVFDYQNADGTWQLCIEDTLQDTLTSSLPGPYMNTFGGGQMGFGTSAGPPPCAWTWNVWNQSYTSCQGTTIDLTAVYNPFVIQTWTLNGNVVANPTVVSTSGVYHVHMDDGWGCTADADVTLTFTVPPVLGSDLSFSVCGSAGINLPALFAGSGAVNNYWQLNTSGPWLNAASLVNVTTPGVYTLYATSILPGNGANTCWDTVNVTIANAVPAYAAQTVFVCTGAPFDLSTLYNTTGLNVTWTYAGNPVPNPSVVTAAGVYTMTATDAGGCSSATTVTINNTTGPALGPDLTGSVCAGSTINLTTQFPTGAAATAWTFNANPVVNPAAVSQSGTYHLVATDVNGCTDEADYFLTNNPNPNLGPNQNINVCAGSIADLTTAFNLSGLAAVWTYGGNPVSNPSAVTQSGSYDVTVTDPNGCTDFAQVMVAYSAAMNLGSNQWVDLCAGATTDLTSLYSTGGWTTQWELNGTVVSNPSAVNAAGVYTITATNPQGCTGTAQVTVTAQAAPSLTISQTVSICNQSSIDITALYFTSGLNVSWTYNSQPLFTPPVNAMMQGDYTITATNSAGCSASSTVTLDVLPKPNLGNDQNYIYCSANAPVDLNTYFNLNGLTPGWTESGNAVSNTLVSVTGNYQLIAVNADGCSDTAMLQIQFDPSIAIGADQTIILCDGQALDLTTLYNTAGYTASWTFNSVPVNNPASVNTAGTYTLTVTAANMCGDDALVQMDYSTPVNLGPAQDYTLCSWQTLDLNSLFNSTGLTFNWIYNGQALTNVAAVHDSGTYNLTATNTDGCTGSSQVIIHDGSCRCDVNFTADAKCTESPATFNLISDSTVIEAHWHFSDGAAEDNFELEPSLKIGARADSITVTLIARLTCGTDTVQKNIKVDECAQACHIYFPSAFSPNEDGLNDHFVPLSDCTPEVYSLQIFNRYGQVVFATNTLTKSWDGKYEQEGMEDLFVYKVKYQFPYQKEKVESGRFTIVR